MKTASSKFSDLHREILAKNLKEGETTFRDPLNYGDSIRVGASTGPEDERDLSAVAFSAELVRAYTSGYLSACGDSLTGKEIETLRDGAKMMTLECGVRFLTDYIGGDSYFHISRPQHNLGRCRTQFKLVEDMERHWDEMQEIALREAGR